MNIEESWEKLNKNEELAMRAECQRRRQSAEDSEVPGRTIDEYEQVLEIPITKEFVGKTVLDLGSGETGQLAKAAAKREIDVYSLSGAWGSEKYRKILKEGFSKNAVAGLAQELPFKSDTFDSVLSSWAIPMYLEKNKREYEASFREIARVLKPGGKAYLAPIYERWISPPFFNEIREALKKEGVANIDIQEVKDPKKVDRYKIVLTKLARHPSSTAEQRYRKP